MKHLLYLIGDELTINEKFKNYIYRTYEEKFKEINEIRIQNKTDKDLPSLHYATVAKILATLNDDNLILKDDTLVPDKAEFNKNSFVCNFSNSKINVVKINPSEKLPNLLGHIKLNFAYFCIFGMDDESAILLLQTLTKSYEISIKSTKLLDNLVLIKATCANFGKLDGFLNSVKNLFGQKVFLGKDPIHFISSKLLEKKLKISFAESCTGGLCARWLGISESVLENNGEYSERCVYFMLKGIFKTANPDFALAISGVVGEKDEGKIKSGTIYIGAMFRDGTFIQETLYLDGDREFMQEQAVLATFCLLLKLKPEIFEI